MAGRKKDIQIEIPIHNEAEWDEMFEAKGLSVVDVHQGWCGPCKAILSMFRRLKMEFGDELLHFHTVQASLIPLLQGFDGKCEPAFLFIVAGKIVDYVKGVNAPVINKKILAYLEMETEYYEKGVERQEIQAVQLYDVEDEIEEFMHAATSRQVDKIFTVVVIKPNAVITGIDNNIKEQISEAGLQIMVEETAQLTEEEAKELYEYKKHQRNYEEIVQTMSSGACDVLLLSGEMKGFEFDVDEAEIAKTNDDDSDVRDLAHKLFSFFFPTIYEKYKKIERTLAIIRPQLLELQKVEILEEIANARFTVGRQKEIKLKERQVTAFYGLSEKNDLPPEFVEYMISGPILALALFRDNAIKHWRNLLGPDDVEQARQDYPTSLRARFALEDIPFNQLHGSQDIETAMKELQFFFPVEHTLVAIKPDTVRQNKDIIIAKIHEGSFTISAIKSIVMSQEIAAEFYKDHEEEPFFNQLIESVSQGPLMAIILTKENAVKEWKELMGPVDLELAKTSFPNSLRAQLESSILKNGLHSSSNAKHAKDHIKKFFGDTLLDSFGVVLDVGVTISSTALLSVSPSAEPSTTAIELPELVDMEAPTDEQEINNSDGKVAPETQDVSVPGEFADSDTLNASAPVEDLDSGTRDVNAPGEVAVISTSDITAPVEISDVGTGDVASPAKVPDAGTADVASPAKVPDAGTADGTALAEVPDTSTQDLMVPDEDPDVAIQDISTPIKGPDSTTQDVFVPSEAPDASNLDVSIPGEAPDSTTQDIPVPDATIKDVSIPGEASDLTIQNVPSSSEDPNAGTQNVSAASEVTDSTIQDVSAHGEAPDASDSSSQGLSTQGEAPDANTEDISTKAPDDNAEDLSAPAVASDADGGETSVPVEAPDANTGGTSAAIEFPDAGNEESSAPINTTDASNEDVPAPREVPDADDGGTSATIEAPDAVTEDIPTPTEATNTGSEDAYAL